MGQMENMHCLQSLQNLTKRTVKECAGISTQRQRDRRENHSRQDMPTKVSIFKAEEKQGQTSKESELKPSPEFGEASSEANQFKRTEPREGLGIPGNKVKSRAEEWEDSLSLPELPLPLLCRSLEVYSGQIKPKRIWTLGHSWPQV